MGKLVGLVRFTLPAKDKTALIFASLIRSLSLTASFVPARINMLGSTSKTPWLTLIGLGEDGPEGLGTASQKALSSAEKIWGSKRHIVLLGSKYSEKSIVWPKPFASGIKPFLEMRGKSTVLIASGDPFWFGAGHAVTKYLKFEEWTAIPIPSSFSLAAAKLGWPLENTICCGLHASNFEIIRKELQENQKLMITLRDGAAVFSLTKYLTETGFGSSKITILEALGGPRERIKQMIAEKFLMYDICHPVLVAVCCKGKNGITFATGKPDSLFQHGGQITKSPIRALTLSALAPKGAEILWDIGAGSGSIAIEWLLTAPSLKAISIEKDPDRAKIVSRNALSLGVNRLEVILGSAPQCLSNLCVPDVIFIGGGLTQELLNYIFSSCPRGTRIVSNSVTLESEKILNEWHAKKGGELMRIDLSYSAPLGRKRGWKSSYPIVQWKCTL